MPNYLPVDKSVIWEFIDLSIESVMFVMPNNYYNYLFFFYIIQWIHKVIVLSMLLVFKATLELNASDKNVPTSFNFIMIMLSDLSFYGIHTLS